MGRPRLHLPAKPCVHCGTEFSRRNLESQRAFHLRRFCSLSCANSRNGTLTKHGYSWRARKYLKPACEACGSVHRRIAHHVDQDIANNTPSNIQTLCKWCHDFWHATQKRLGLNIAGRMPRLHLDGKQVFHESHMASRSGWTDLKGSATLSSRRSPTKSCEKSGS